MKNTPFRSVATALITLGAPGLLLAQTTWDAGGSDTNWSTLGNWSTDASPAATPLAFGGTTVGLLGVTTNATTVGNVVDGSVTVDSMTYNNTGAGWQVTQIASGQTLTIDASTAPSISLLVGGYSAATTTTQVAIGGLGSLVVNEPTAEFRVSNNGGNNAGRAVLDMSALGSFAATVGAFSVGGSYNDAYGTLYLSDDSVITATTLTTGAGANDYNNRTHISNRLYLGADTTFNADTISLAAGRTAGLVQFRPASIGANTTAVTNGVLKIRGTAGAETRAVLSIGDLQGGGSSSNATSHVDLTSGTVDAMISTLKIGRSAATLSGNYTASLSIAGGTVDATTVIVGETSTNSGGTGSMTGNLNVSGGTFTAGTMTLGNNLTSGTRATKGNLNVTGGTVDVTGNLGMGVRTAATVTPTVSVSAGTLSVGGNLAEGSGAGVNIVSTVNLSGGTLDLTGGNIAVDTFNFTGGTLKDVASFDVDTLAFNSISGSFSAKSLTGSLTLESGINLSLTLAADYVPVSGFTLISNDGTGDSIAGTFATINGGAFGSGNSFSLTNNMGTYNFELNYAGGDGNDLVATLSMIPEPSTYAALAGVLTLGLSVWRRRR